MNKWVTNIWEILCFSSRLWYLWETWHFVSIKIPAAILHLLFILGAVGTNKRNKALLWLLKYLWPESEFYQGSKLHLFSKGNNYLQFDSKWIITWSKFMRKIISLIKRELNRWLYICKKNIKLLRQKVLIAIMVSQTSFSTSSLANIPLVILTLK